MGVHRTDPVSPEGPAFCLAGHLWGIVLACPAHLRLPNRGLDRHGPSAHDHFVCMVCGVTINRKYVNMADIIFSSQSREQAALNDAAREPIWDLIELLFFAYRDFVSDPDHVLETFGFGRAHHRVLHFVNRNPGMKVADLLVVLKITKQSLGRVLKQLIEEGYVVQKEGENDRRQRLLYVT